MVNAFTSNDASGSLRTMKEVLVRESVEMVAPHSLASRLIISALVWWKDEDSSLKSTWNLLTIRERTMIWHMAYKAT